MSAVLRVESLCKTFLKGSQRSASYRTLREQMRSWLRFTGRGPSTDAREFHALRDLSFEIAAGEIVGVIGRNGAGKSTLLKIISRISPPTSGRVRIRGRVASLLEVGTGFHMELSGRDNIFLNGAILGMRKRDIAARFDEIVAFAGVESFIDTPVKHYSSGMYVRLAFAVAAHLEQEIMLVDEVLAVGDAAFQERCIGRMQQMSRSEGRTVLFVSHNNAAVANLCTRGLVLANGQLQFDGSAREALTHYNQSLSRRDFRPDRGGQAPQIIGVQIDEQALSEHVLRVSVQFWSPRPLNPPLLGVVVHTLFGAPIFGFNTQQDRDFDCAPISEGEAVLTIARPPLVTGPYKISVWFGERNENFDVQHDVLTFDYVGERHLPPGVAMEVAGPVAVDGNWQVGEMPSRTMSDVVSHAHKDNA